MKTGIYKIICNGKIYIGSANNIDKRWKRHVNDLKKNKHVNIHLQRAFDKYGIESFHFEIVELCNKEELLLKEQLYIDNFQPFNENGFNIGKKASGGDNLTNNPNRENIIDRMTKTLNLTISKMSEDERKNKWARIGILNPNYGKNCSEEIKVKISLNNKGRVPNNKGKTNKELYGDIKAQEISEKISKFASERIGEKNPFFNKHHSDETKEKIREKAIGRKPVNRIKISIDGIIYESYNDASKKLGLPVVTIRWRCLSNNPKFYNFFIINQLDNIPFKDSEDS